MQIELEKKVRHSKHPVEEDLTFKRKTRSARQRQHYTLLQITGHLQSDYS